MTHVPGIRPIDPDTEAARLARERLDPPGREWAIRHPGGKVTHVLQSQPTVEWEREGRPAP